MRIEITDATGVSQSVNVDAIEFDPETITGSITTDEGRAILSLSSVEMANSEDDAYAGSSSYQTSAADVNVDAAAGKNVADGTAFLAGVMGNILGAALSKTGNYLGGLIGHFNVTGTNATTYPSGAVLAGIGDGVTDADGAVVAYIDGDSATTTAGAAFKVRSNNSTAASGFDYALDCQDAAHDGFQPVDSAFYNAGIIRLVEDVVFLVGTGTPTNGVTGADIAGKGSLHLNSSDGKLRTNTNTKASPTWTIVGTQS